MTGDRSRGKESSRWTLQTGKAGQVSLSPQCVLNTLKNLKNGKISYKKPDSQNLLKRWKSGNTDGVEGLSVSEWVRALQSTAPPFPVLGVGSLTPLGTQQLMGRNGVGLVHNDNQPLTWASELG